MTDLRKKFAEVQPEPLFDTTPLKARKPEQKPRNVRNVGRAKCPDCGDEVGLYVLATPNSNRYQRVLAYKRHWRQRYSSTPFLCPKSDTEAPRPEGTSL